MAGEHFAQFMQRRGRRVVEGAGTRWYSNSLGIYMSIPYHEPCHQPEEQIARLIRKTRMLGVRFPSPHLPGLISGVYVRRGPYDLSAVQARLRSKVRKGLSYCEIRQVEPSELLRDGLQCNLDTMQRQNRADAEFGEPKRWQHLVQAVTDSPGIDAVGAFVDGKLAAYIIGCREDGWFHLLHQMSRLDSLDFAPNHTLTFEVIKRALEDPGIDAACFGLVGLISGHGLNDYKLRLGCEVQPMNSVFMLHPAAGKLLSNSAALQGISWLRNLYPNYHRIAQIESVITGARLTRMGLTGSTQARHSFQEGA